jgi:hypothetical protein
MPEDIIEFQKKILEKDSNIRELIEGKFLKTVEFIA